MKKKIVSLMLAGLSATVMAACGGAGNTATGPLTTYVVNFKTVQGKNLDGASISVQKNGKEVAKATTDSDGDCSFRAPQDSYELVVKGLESHVYFDAPITIDGKKTDYAFVAKTKMIDEEMPYQTHYKIGDVVYDFPVNLAWYEGATLKTKTFKASEYLKDHDLLVVNLFATWCGPCKKEFPYMEKALESMKDDVALTIFSIDEDAETVAEFKNNMGYSFDMGWDPLSYPAYDYSDHHEGEKIPDALMDDFYSSPNFAFSTTSVPTTAIIDKYGTMINKIVGTSNSVSESTFTSEWGNYLGEDYDPAYWVKVNKSYYDKYLADTYEKGYNYQK